VLAFVTFGTNFAALTESPGALAAAPYSLSAVLIGVTFLSDGISGLIGSPIGGWVSDHAAAKHPKVPEARLMHNTLCTLLGMPAGLVLYGWVLQRGAHLALIILAQVRADDVITLQYDMCETVCMQASMPPTFRLIPCRVRRSRRR
jgi:nitrate/nitrite transporter NarK